MSTTLEDSIVTQLKKLLNRYPSSFYDLVRGCRDGQGSNLVLDPTTRHHLYVLDLGPINTQSEESKFPSEALKLVVRARVRGRGKGLYITEKGKADE